MLTVGNGGGLLVGLRGEVRRADVGHPDLDRTKPLRPEPLAVLAHALRPGYSGSSAGHTTSVTCNDQRNNLRCETAGGTGRVAAGSSPAFDVTRSEAWSTRETEDVSAAPTLLIGDREADLARLADICRRFGVVELATFGSTVRNEATLESDIDLLYVMAPDRRLGFAIDRLEDELEELFGRKVDLVSKRSLHRLLRGEVLAEARTLYAA